MTTTPEPETAPSASLPPTTISKKESKRHHNVSWAICMFLNKIISFLRVLTKVLDYL